VARHPEQTRRRLEQTATRLRSLVHSETIAPASLTVSERTGRDGWGAARELAHRPVELGEEFGPQWATYWFRIGAAIPDRWAGGRVELIWDSGSEATLWRDGRVVQGLYSGWRAQRDTAVIASPAAGDERFELEVEMACNSWAGDDPEPEPGVDRELAARYRLGRTWTETPAVIAARHQPACARLVRCAIGLFDPLAWRLASDFDLLRRLEGEHDRCLEPDWAGTLLAGLNRFCNTWDPGERESWEQGAAILAELLGRGGARPRHRVHAVGHAHIDTAWVWPVAETRRKIVRSTASQLELMDRYPDYRFAASSAQHYAWLEQDAPELFARVAARIAEGRWEPVGGSWVEPDCNLPSGESLVRQLLYGQRYFESRFGRRCDVYWSPDTFGHNGQMPQILRHCGIERFLTQKLSWNQFTRPPHDSFTWVGIDGSEVTAHLPPIGTYNAELTPGQLRRGVAAFRDHDRSSVSLALFGHGDGGGGPTAEMLEAASRTADLRGLPELEQSPSARFFERLEEERAGLGRIRGQLYFEYHRGTYTSQARTKRGNREGERALHDAEAAATLAWARGLAPYPAEEIAQLWPTLLRNQFHDILPGTSLREVHERTEREHRELRAAAEAVRERAVAALADDRPGDGAPLNLCGFARREVIETPGGLALAASPALGFGRRVEPAAPVEVTRDGDRIRVSNSLVAAELATDGRLLGLRRADGAEALAAPANLFELFDDRPTAFDAWELEPYAAETREPVDGAHECELVAEDPLRAELRFRHAVGRASTLEHRIRLDAESDRLEFSCLVDWHERHRLLRVSFPLAVRTGTATYGAPFGAHELSTHRNTDADLAHFEAPAVGFLDLSEHRAGVAVLSGTCYGFGVDEHVVGLSLLRSPTDPDPDADQGEHRLAYALQPHAGDWRRAGVARAAIAFDRPQPWVGGAAPGEGFAALDSEDLILDTVKHSEDGEDLVLRLYEPHGARGEARLTIEPGFDGEAVRANGLEDPGQSLARDGRALRIAYRPFELITVRLARSA